MGLGKLVLRATLGGYFFGHGMQKLAGWFGGGGPEGTGEFFEQVGLRPGRENALLAGAAEAGGGALLALGLLTPAAVSMLTGVMTNAIRHVHRQNGLWVTDGGIEYPAVILAVLAALADSGPGRFSLDEALGIRLRGPVVTALAMGAGAAGAVYVAERGQELFDSARRRRGVEPVGGAGRGGEPSPPKRSSSRSAYQSSQRSSRGSVV